jgi:very-short-patch-repair endonuclease
MGAEVNEVLRRLARDQWVRLHGTPRVTVLVGADARDVFMAWLSLGELKGRLLDGDLDRAIREACAQVSETPSDIVAVATTKPAFDAWRNGRMDRLAAMVDEGFIEIPDTTMLVRDHTAAQRARQRDDVQHAMLLDARSAAEAALYQALEATPATAGRFELNGYLSVRFGSVACEVDLLSRGDGIAIEIDGIHHFADPSCYRRDRRKDLLLQTQGLIVIRVLAEDALADPREAINSVCQALAFRRGVQ